MKNNILYAGINGSVSRILFFIFQFLTHIFLANYLGNKGYGVYQLSISIILIFSIFGHFGLPKVALKFIPDS